MNPVGHSGERVPTVAEILELVSRETGVSLLDLRSHRRSRQCARPRQLAMWLVRHTTLLTFPQIGRALDRDHTTVMHAIHKIDELRAISRPTRELSDRLLSMLRDDPNQLRLIA